MDRLIDDMIRGTEYERKQLRAKRKSLLEAFDKYKTNVQYGIVEETQEQHETVLAWYHGMLELDREAFDNVPDCITYYVQKGGKK